MNKTYKFHVVGMHCHACVLMTDSELSEVPGVSSARSNLASRTVEVVGDFGGKTTVIIAQELSMVLSKHGYTLTMDASNKEKKWKEFVYAIPTAMVFLFGFIGLQKAGLVNLVTANEVSYGTAFFVGIIASLSTCMAVVGGLVLSLSASFAKAGEDLWPHVMFHAGRIAAFFVLGGVIGALGTGFTISSVGMMVMSVLVGAVMVLLGVNLLDIFDVTKALMPAMPRGLSGLALRISSSRHALSPALIGIATFFLPCGFTQSMQLYTLTTGGFFKGGLTMLAFVLGTLPVLALISFGSFSIEHSAVKGVFFKSAGIVVIAFALFNIINALVAGGVMAPVFNL